MGSALLLAVLLLLPQDGAPPASDGGTAGEPADEAVVREGTVLVDGEEIAYRSEAGRLVLRRESGEARASVFYVSYVREGVEDRAARPLTVCFNGGPGSSSVWLHLGAFGPRRVDLGPQGFDAEPPFRLVDNHATILDLTDLVFVDPVMTGYSRPAEGEEKAQFHGVREDVESVGEFVRLFLTRKERWTSPLLLAGESYGTTRAAALADHLQSRHGIYPVGLVLVSAVLDFQTLDDDSPSNDVAYPLFLPSLAATAWYHGRVEGAEDLASLLAEVEAFAGGEYLLALHAGDALGDEEREAVAARLARYLGVSPEFVLRNDLRVGLGRFAKELLRDRRRTVGRLDSRYVGIDRDAGGGSYGYDPSYAAIQGPYSTTLNHYVRAELGYESDLPYEILTGRVHPWSYEPWENRYVNVAEDLRHAMSVNRDLDVYVANGFYDLATPYHATEYTFRQMRLDPELRGNVSMGYFEAGHMMYVQVSSLEALKEDLVAFYAKALR